MRWILLGDDIGNGKTLSTVFLGYIYYLQGYDIYSNIELKGGFKEFHFIDGTNFLNDLEDNQSKKIVIGDDIGESTYGMTSSSVDMSHMIAQSRKSIGEHSHLIFNTPSDIMLNPFLKRLCDGVIIPEIPKNARINGVPQYILWYVWNKKKDYSRGFTGASYFHPQKRPLIIWTIKDVMGFYDTHKVTSKFKTDMMYDKMLKKYKSLIGNKKMRTILACKLETDEGINPTKAKRIATSIIFYDKEEDSFELFKA